MDEDASQTPQSDDGVQPRLEKPLLEKPRLEKPRLEKPRLEKPRLEKPRLEKPRLEKPLQSRRRLSTPPVQEGPPTTRFANMALGLYATMCNVVGLVFTLTGAFMSEWLGVAGWILTLFGVLVLLWSFMVTLYANRRVSRRSEVERVVKINVVLIVAAVLWITLAGGMTSDGRMVFGALAVATAGFSAAQYFASRSLP